MDTQAALTDYITNDDEVLYIGFDVGRRRWRAAMNDGSEKVKSKWIKPYDLEQLEERIEWAAEYFDLADEFAVLTCYEAGGQGFAIHRWLEKQGISNLVVDPGSVLERKNGPRAKTDRTDAERLVRGLDRYTDGDVDSFNPVHVPDPEDEDARRMFRERERLLKEKNGHVNRMQDLLATQGLEDPPSLESVEFVDWLEEVETPDGRKLGESLKAELCREQKRLQLVEMQLEQLETQRDKYLAGKGDDKKIELVRRLTMFRGVGVTTAWALVVEMFGWRAFENRREVGAYVGLDGRRDDSGERDSDRGITGKGNDRIRRMAIQLAHNWLHWQSDSYLAEWARENFGDGDGGVSHCGVVALARKLLNRLRVFAHGEEPPWGAKLSSPAI